MKQTSTCPKCGSTEILKNVRVLDRAKHGRYDLTLATFRNPDALIFTGEQNSAVSAHVCSACGFTEFYATTPKALIIQDSNVARIIIGLLCLVYGQAFAALEVSLTPSLQNSARGAEIVFTGTLTNTSNSARVFVNDLSFTLNGSAATQLTPNSNGFFANVPGILEAGESYHAGEVFRLGVNANAPFGDYSGSTTILGGEDMEATTGLATVSFTVRVPNPATDGGDDDHDGLPNLLEYALNLDSQSPNAATASQPTVTASYLTLNFTPNAAATDVSFVVEGSTDLTSWSTSNVEEVTPLNALPSGTRTYRFTSNTNTATRGFLRVRVIR